MNMYNSDTELLFPSRVIPELRDLRNKPWRELVDRAAENEPDDLDHLAFVLMMVEVDGCTTCSADSFRAMRGCTQCAFQNVRRFRGPDRELVKMYNQARRELSKSSAISKNGK
jgi:hypothetical protein